MIKGQRSNCQNLLCTWDVYIPMLGHEALGYFCFMKKGLARPGQKTADDPCLQVVCGHFLPFLASALQKRAMRVCKEDHLGELSGFCRLICAQRCLVLAKESPVSWLRNMSKLDESGSCQLASLPTSLEHGTTTTRVTAPTWHLPALLLNESDEVHEANAVLVLRPYSAHHVTAHPGTPSTEHRPTERWKPQESQRSPGSFPCGTS